MFEDFLRGEFEACGVGFKTRPELDLIPKLMYMQSLNNNGRKLGKLKLTRLSFIHMALVDKGGERKKRV